MIPELIRFSEELGDYAGVRREIKEPVIVIKTIEKDNKIVYSNYEILENDELIENHIKNTPDIKFASTSNGLKIWLLDQIEIRKINEKRLGSTSGLLTSVPYALRLTDKNIGDFERKLEKTKTIIWTNKWQEELFLQFKQVLGEFWGKFDKGKLVKNSLVFILLPENINSINRKEAYESFSRDQKIKSPFSKEEYVDSGVCPVCEKERRIGPPRTETYQLDKPFFRRSDRPDKYGIRVCSDCHSNYEKAWSKISDYKFRIFPIFEKQKYKELNFKYIDQETGLAKSFEKIFNELDDKGRYYDFIIVAQSKGKIWLFDYVGSYTHKINDENNYTRFEFERDMLVLLGHPRNKGQFNYFDEVESSNYSQLILSYRHKIFNFVYRGENKSIGIIEVKTIVNEVSLHMLKNDEKEGNIKEIVITGIKIIEGLEMEDKNLEDAKNAKNFGYLVRVLLNLSEAENKHQMLSLIVEKHSTDQLKYAVVRLLEKYRHKTKELEETLNKENKQKIITECLEAKFTETKFDPLKIYFYAGYFEVNVNE